MPDPETQAESFANPPVSQAEAQMTLPGIYSMPKEIVMLFLDSTAQIERIKHNLAGEVIKVGKDKEGNLFQFWAPEGEKKMNEKGIRHIVSLLDAYINPNTATTTLSDSEIYSMSKRFYKTLNGVLRSKGEEFEVDNNYKTTILNVISDMVFIELKKAKDGATLKALTQAYQVRELKGYGNEKKGFQISDLSPLNLKKG